MNYLSKGTFIITLAGFSLLPLSSSGQISQNKNKIAKEISINHKDILDNYIFNIMKKCNYNKEETEKLIRKHIIIEINNIRKLNNLKELKEDINLTELAQNHSKDMLDKGYYSHIDRDHQNPSQRAHNAGLKIYNLLENIDKGSISINQVINEMWMLSTKHKENILDPNITHIGAGINFGKDTNISEIYRVINMGFIDQ